MKRYTSIFFSLILVLASSVGAQTRQPFVPNTTQTQTTGQRTFGGGVNFTGVGGAIAGCIGVGGYIRKGIGSLSESLKKKSDASSALQQSVATNDSGTRTEVEEQNKKERCLDAAAYALAERSLQQVTNRTLSWVNTGFAGNPLYIRDTQSFLSSIANQQVRTFLGQSAQLNRGGATGSEVSNGLISILTGRRAPLIDNAPQTPAQQEYRAFMDDFRNGGWNNWLRTIDSRTNPIAQTLRQSQNLQNTINNAQTSIIQELQQGQGFLSQKKCVEYAQISPDDDIAFINSQLDETGKPQCLRYETVTPGAVIASQVQSVTNSPTRRLEQADEINEVLGAFFDQFMNRLFSQGLQGLANGRTNRAVNGLGGPGSNVIIGSNGQALAGVAGLLDYRQGTSGLSTADFNISNPRHLSAILKTQKDFYNQAQDSQAALQKLPLSLGKLDYCVPGPNPSWVTGVENSYPGFQGAIVTGRPYLKGAVDLGEYLGFDAATGQQREIRTDGTTIGLDKMWSHTIINGQPATQGALGSLIGGLLGNFPEINMSGALARVVAIADDWFGKYRGDIENRYGLKKLQDSFAATQNSSVEQSFARTYVKDMYTQTEQLTAYAQASAVLDSEYNDVIDETAVAIDRLETIRAEALAIVTEARARHIAEKRAQGITVNLECLDQNYDVRDTVITGQLRQESDADTEKALLEKYRNEFYSNINPL